jgi:hypothetical protein
VWGQARNCVQAADVSSPIGMYAPGFYPVIRLAELADTVIGAHPLLEVKDGDIVVFPFLRHGAGQKINRLR